MAADVCVANNQNLTLSTQPVLTLPAATLARRVQGILDIAVVAIRVLEGHWPFAGLLLAFCLLAICIAPEQRRRRETKDSSEAAVICKFI